MEYQLRPGDARKLLRAILLTGVVTYSNHAKTRMEERQITTIDCENVLWAGKVRHPDWINSTWRYSVASRKHEIVIEFVSQHEIFIVTAMKKV